MTLVPLPVTVAVRLSGSSVCLSGTRTAPCCAALRDLQSVKAARPLSSSSSGGRSGSGSGRSGSGSPAAPLILSASPGTGNRSLLFVSSSGYLTVSEHRGRLHRNSMVPFLPPTRPVKPAKMTQQVSSAAALVGVGVADKPLLLPLKAAVSSGSASVR